jgi:amino acid transporter
VPEVHETLRAHYDHVGAAESEGQVPEVQEHEGRAAARQFHGADVEEELTVNQSPARSSFLYWRGRLRRLLFGAPRDVQAPGTFHQISLVAFLAWVGLGADGLSSSCYGPEDSLRALGEHHYLAVGLALAMAFTVFIISYAYSRIIEHFPFGGGGYVVATKLLGPRFGVVSGCALLVDYVLTITVSIAAGADATFSFLPPEWHGGKLSVVVAATLLLTQLNLRGVKESVTVLAPIFLTFLVTHAVMILGTIALHGSALPEVAREIHTGFQHGVATLGAAGLAALFIHAYSMGAGTYTGIEAVSNGLQIMREPKVDTAKRTMLYIREEIKRDLISQTLNRLRKRVNSSVSFGRSIVSVILLIVPVNVKGGW